MSEKKAAGTFAILCHALALGTVTGWEVGLSTSLAFANQPSFSSSTIAEQLSSPQPLPITTLGQEEVLTIADQSRSISSVPTIADAPIMEFEEMSISSDLTPNTIDSITEINLVSELADVHSGDWAFQTLQFLIEQYDCIADDVDMTASKEQVLTRYEFAVILNLCLTQINESITEETIDLATQEDLATLQRLSQEFATELTTIHSQVNTLEARTTALEAGQFSTTTQLLGEVIFAATGIFGDEVATSEDANESLNETVIFSNRVRLFLNTSFTGQDLLRVRLQSGNTPNLSEATGTNMARLGFDANTENQLELNQLYYRFPIGESIEVTAIVSGTLFDVADTLNPLLGSDSKGSPFLFGVRSPIYREGIGGTGAGISYDLTSNVNLALVYLTAEASQTSSGLFSGPFSALGQITWRPNDDIGVGLVYSRSYNEIDINAGSSNANAPFGEASQHITANSYGLVAHVYIGSDFALGGWAGLVQATATDLPDNPTADISYYAVTLAFPDLGQEGNLAGIVFGQPPKLIRNEFAEDDPHTAFNIEAFYRLQMNDYISITPGFLIITNPEHDRHNSPIYIGTIRTTFSF